MPEILIIGIMEKKVTKKTEEAYLTKRFLVRKATQAVKVAAEESMAVMGYNVIEHEGWIVKKFKDGKIEKIEKLKGKKAPFRLA